MQNTAYSATLPSSLVPRRSIPRPSASPPQPPGRAGLGEEGGGGAGHHGGLLAAFPAPPFCPYALFAVCSGLVWYQVLISTHCPPGSAQTLHQPSPPNINTWYKVPMGWAGLGWAGLGWLGWAGWAGLGWAELSNFRLFKCKHGKSRRPGRLD